jgi:hypothetical protein
MLIPQRNSRLILQVVPVARILAGRHAAASSYILSRPYSTPDGKDGGGKKAGIVQRILGS